jgi:hypothetical protein
MTYTRGVSARTVRRLRARYEKHGFTGQKHCPVEVRPAYEALRRCLWDP